MRDAPDPGRRARHALALAVAASRAGEYRVYLGEGADGPVFAPPEHCVLALGPPRSGKTSGVVVPNVISTAGSVLAASTKPDVLLASSPARRRIGPCLLYDPSGRTDAPPGVERVGWSPLASAGSWDCAVLMAEAMVGAARPSGDRGDAAHWNERAGALLACMLHAAALDGAGADEKGLDGLVSAVNRHDGDRCTTVLTREGADLALDLMTGIMATDAREQSGIWSTASGVLSGYRTSAALASTRGRVVDIESLVDEPATLYVAASSDHQRHVAPLIAGLVRDVRAVAYERAAARLARDTSMRGIGPSSSRACSGGRPPLLLVLDEMAGIAPLHDLPALVAEGASQGIVTLACLQDLSQARARWGQAADGFVTLFGTKVVLPGVGDTRTLEALSLVAGETDVPHLSTTRPARLFAGRSGTRTVSTRRQRRLPPDAIANGPPGTALVYVGTSPGRVALTPYFAQPRLRTISTLGTRVQGIPTISGR